MIEQLAFLEELLKRGHHGVVILVGDIRMTPAPICPERPRTSEDWDGLQPFQTYAVVEEALGWSQGRMAQAIGVSVRFLQRMKDPSDTSRHHQQNLQALYDFAKRMRPDVFEHLELRHLGRRKRPGENP